MLKIPYLYSERLKLRGFVQEDLADIFLALSDPAVIKYYGIQYSTLNETQRQIDWFRDLQRNHTGLWWAIILRETGQFIGGVGLYNYVERIQKAEIGFWLLPKFWHNGYMKEAARLVIDYAVDKMNVKRIEAYTETPNVRSKNLLRKLHFIHHKTKHNCEEKNGQLISLDLFLYERR